jgi:hypothetical protein
VSEKIITETVERTVLVDDLTGDEIVSGGWMLTGARNQGEAHHFQSLSNMVELLLTKDVLLDPDFLRAELERRGVLEEV